MAFLCGGLSRNSPCREWIFLSGLHLPFAISPKTGEDGWRINCHEIYQFTKNFSYLFWGAVLNPHRCYPHKWQTTASPCLIRSFFHCLLFRIWFRGFVRWKLSWSVWKCNVSSKYQFVRDLYVVDFYLFRFQFWMFCMAFCKASFELFPSAMILFL